MLIQLYDLDIPTSDKAGKESQYMVSHSKLGSNPPIGSDRDSGCDNRRRLGKEKSENHIEKRFEKQGIRFK